MNRHGWRSQVINATFLTSAVLCFIATIMVGRLIMFMVTHDLLDRLDLFFLLSFALCFGLLGWISVLALRARLRGERAYSRQIVIPALALYWVMLGVATFGRLHVGKALDQVLPLAGMLAVAVAMLSLNAWRQLRSSSRAER